MKVYIRYLMVILAGLLVIQPSMAQTGNSSGADLEQYRLSGVLISETRRTALVNGRTVQEGATIGGAVVEVIEKRQIQVRNGSTRQIIRVGGSFTAGPSRDDDRQVMIVSRSTPASERWSSEPGNSREPAIAGIDSKPADASRSAPGSSDKPALSGEHFVSEGETLSGIALRYRQDGIATNQVMVAIFEANPSAFNGNINALKAGAILRIPDRSTTSELAPDIAMAEVTRQYERSRNTGAATPIQMVDTLPASKVPTGNRERTYGPVQRGDTLSEIAGNIIHAKDGLSNDQVMIALYQENPHAFGDSINLLYEGAVLTIPLDTRIAAVSPADATAEVERQLSVARRSGRGNEYDDPGFNVNSILSAGDPADWMNWQRRARSPH